MKRGGFIPLANTLCFRKRWCLAEKLPMRTRTTFVSVRPFATGATWTFENSGPSDFVQVKTIQKPTSAPRYMFAYVVGPQSVMLFGSLLVMFPYRSANLSAKVLLQSCCETGMVLTMSVMVVLFCQYGKLFVYTCRWMRVPKKCQLLHFELP